MVKTKARTLERPRPGVLVNQDGTIFEHLAKGQTRTTSYGSLHAGGSFQARMSKQPHIEVRIKPRAKDHPSDDFKVVVTYTITLSKEEQEQLGQLVPATPTNVDQELG